MLSQPSTPEPEVASMYLETLKNFSFYRSPLELMLTLDIPSWFTRKGPPQPNYPSHAKPLPTTLTTHSAPKNFWPLLYAGGVLFWEGIGLSFHPWKTYGVFNMNQKANLCFIKMSLSLYRLNKKLLIRTPLACGVYEKIIFHLPCWIPSQGFFPYSVNKLLQIVIYYLQRFFNSSFRPLILMEKILKIHQFYQTGLKKCNFYA